MVQSRRDATVQSGGLLAGDRLWPALVVALTFVAYSGTLAFGFVFDDRSQVLENYTIQSWRYLPGYFTSHVWSYYDPGGPGNYYRPVFLLWLRLNHALFGLEPPGWHLTSVAAHVFVTLLVYWLALRVLRDQLTAAVTALIFGLHPGHIEAVAWVSGVTEPLLALLLIPSFLCYLNQRERARPERAWRLLSLLFYALAMLTKETALVLPMMVFGYEWIFRCRLEEPAGSVGRQIRGAIRRVAPYLVLTGVYLIVRAAALKGLAHALTPLPLGTMVFTWPSLLWFYLKLLVWPVGVSPFYDMPYVTLPGFSNCLLPAGAVVAAAILLWAWSRKAGEGTASGGRLEESRAVAFASLWLLLPFIPLLNLSFFPEGEIAHDRYLYLPSVGFSILAAMAWRHISLGRARLFGQPAAQVISALALACLLGIGTVTQSLYWADDLLLYYRGASMAPRNGLVQNNLAIIMGERGLHDVAVKLFHQILNRNPNSSRANYNLGYAYYRLGRLAEAEWYLTRAIALNPTDANEYLYLGLTRFKMGRADEAALLIRHAIELQPEAPGYHFALGVVLESKGELERALEEFKLELVNDPQHDAARAQIAALEQRMRSSSPKGQPGSAPHELSGEKTH